MLAFLSDIFVVGLLIPFMLGLKTEQDTVHPVHPESPGVTHSLNLTRQES